MFCTRCGTQLRDEARYCTACGKSTTAPAVAGPIDYSPVRRLRRIRSQKKLAGVCAGFAEYFGMDVTLMRLIWVGLAIMPPSVGLIAYPLSWIVLPRE